MAEPQPHPNRDREGADPTMNPSADCEPGGRIYRVDGLMRDLIRRRARIRTTADLWSVYHAMHDAAANYDGFVCMHDWGPLCGEIPHIHTPERR